jgi:hypothetical protein
MGLTVDWSRDRRRRSKSCRHIESGPNESKHLPPRHSKLCRGIPAAFAVIVLANVVATGASAASAPWTTQTIPSLSRGTGSMLNAVSCPSASFCVAVGQSSSSGVIESWNGTGWALAATTQVSLGGVSCLSTSACIAVGGDESAVLMAWNGAAWMTQKVSSPDPFRPDFVECLTVTNCFGLDGGDARIQHWNGTRWVYEQSPLLPKAEQPGLKGLSCATATSCMAVGFRLSGPTRIVPLTERSNGTSWKSVPTQTSLGPAAQLFGVSCPSPTRCVAVGGSGPAEDGTKDDVPLVGRWNGRRWTLGLAPGKDFELSSVACVSASACTAVGGGDASSGGTAHIEFWNGRRWSIESNPAQHGSPSDLTSVSCTAPHDCTAVGYDIDGGGALVEREGGSGGPGHGIA